MSISPEFIEILRCPACLERVRLTTAGDGLKCVSCHRVYPIRDEIPIMLIDEAVIEEDRRRSFEPGRRSSDPRKV